MSSLELILSNLAEQRAPRSQVDRIASLVDLATCKPALKAIALVGSYARGTGTRISDLDLVALVEEGQVEQVLSAVFGLFSSAEVLNSFRGAHSAGGIFCKLVYLDFSSVEFHVLPASSEFRLRRPYIAVWDPLSLLPSLVVPGEPVQHKDFPAYQYGDDGLIWELVDCIKWLSRGENELAKRHILKLAEQLGQHRAA